MSAVNPLGSASPAAGGSAGKEQLRGIWRRRLTISVVAGLGAIATMLLAALLPPTYQASSTILIERQEMPQDFVRSTITSFAGQRIQVINQRVMTTQNLLALIERYGLYPELKDKAREVVLERMRADSSLRMISANVNDPGTSAPVMIAFAVSYANRSPDVAYKVASELTTLYLNENVSSRSRQSAQAAKFLSDEANRLQGEVVALETRLTAFKEKHAGRLPELQQLNLSVVDRTDYELRALRDRRRDVAQQRALLEAQLAVVKPNTDVVLDNGARVLGPADRLKALRAQLAGYEARYSPDHPDVVATRRAIAGLEAQMQTGSSADGSDLARQLGEAEAQLGVARGRYAPDHPDVVRYQKRVETLRVQLAAAPVIPRAVTGPADNPAYVQLKSTLDGLDNELAALDRKESDAQAKLADFERRLAQAPEIEQEYRVLARDYGNASQKYQEVRAKQMEAQLSQNLETDLKGERFTLLEPPQPPSEPISPNRKLILILGLTFSLGLGLVAALAREAIDATVRGPGDVRRLLEVPPLAELPTIVNAEDRQRARRQRRLAFASAAASSLVVLLFVHLFVKPLDVAWLILQQRLGI